jgi:hypothetical protein
VDQRTIYFDANVMISAFEGDDSVLTDRVVSLLDDPGSVLVLSMSNLLEFSQTDKRSDALDLVRIATSYPHYWIRPFEELHQETIANFARVNYFGSPAVEFSPFFLSFQNFFKDSKIAISPEAFVEFSHGSRSLRELQENQIQHASVLAELQKNSTKKLFTKALVEDITLKGIQNFLGSELELASEYCLRNASKMYKACPSLNCERHLSTFRASNPRRKPRASDSIDLISSIAAFPFVDMFVSFDGYLVSGLRYVKTKCADIQTQLIDRSML